VDSAARGTSRPAPSRAVRRSRPVEVDFRRIFPGRGDPSSASVARELVLNLFADVCVTARLRRAADLAPGKIEWVGDVAPRGELTLIIDHDVIIGRVTRDGEVFHIGWLGNGVHMLFELDPTALPKD
jgi:hypothetical protein